MAAPPPSQAQEATSHGESVADKLQHLLELCSENELLLQARLLALCQVLASIGDQPVTNGSALQGLYNVLVQVEEEYLCGSANRLVCVVQATQRHLTLVTLLQAVTSRLQELLSGLTVQSQLHGPLADYMALQSQQAVQLSQWSLQLEQEQAPLALCASPEEFHALLQNRFDTPLEQNEWIEALDVLQQELGQLSVQLLSSDYDNSTARGKAVQYQGFLGIVVARLQAHPFVQQQQSLTTTTPGAKTTVDSDYPAWALDPLTGLLMTVPVTLRAPCECVMDKTTFVHWMKQSSVDAPKNKCPVCKEPMTSIAAKPNKELKRKIQLLVLDQDQDQEDVVVGVADTSMDDSSTTIRPTRMPRRTSSMDDSVAMTSIQEDKPLLQDDSARTNSMDMSLTELRRTVTDSPTAQRRAVDPRANNKFRSSHTTKKHPDTIKLAQFKRTLTSSPQTKPKPKNKNLFNALRRKLTR